MIVTIKEPHKPARQEDIPRTLEALRQCVGGRAASVRLLSDMYVITDMEGKSKGKPANILGLHGTVVFCGSNGNARHGLPSQLQDNPLF